MSKIFKLVVIFFSGICFLIITGILFIGFVTNQSIPNYKRIVESSLIGAEIKVFRDNYAIPDIQGKTEEDVFFALGYVHAQDRLWQMLLLRQTAQGKLSEYFGKDTLDTDIFIRTLNIYNHSKESVSHLSTEILELMKAYSNGINQRLKDIGKEGLGRGAPNLLLFPPKVAPWSPADSIAILKLLALKNNESAKKEVIRLNLLKSGISIKRLSDLFFDIPDISMSTTLSHFEHAPKANSSRLNLNNYSLNQSLIGSIFKNYIGTVNASNIWVSLPSRTASGTTLVGYNLHTNFDIPLIWMLAKLKLESGPIVGATIPGIPAILTGRSKFLSWGIASSNLDNQDLIIEQINQTNPDQYLDKSGYKNFDKRNVLINVKGEPGLTHTVKSTIRGPIIPPKSYGIESITSPSTVVALKWTGLDNKDRSIESFITAMKAQNILSAKNAFKHLVVPSYNILIADTKNAIMVSAGKIPNRTDNSGKGFGIIPTLGWKNPMKWSEFIDFEENPFVTNPPDGILFNTNSKLATKEFPKHFSYDWADNQRQLRMKELFEKRNFHSLQSFKEIQTDTVSPSARTLLPLLGKNLWYSQVLDVENNLFILREKALNLLAEWNGEMSIHLPQPLIYYSWSSQFQKMVIQDELGSQINWFESIKPDFLERVLKNIEGAGIWCDIIQTKIIETCDDIALMSLDNALVTNSKLIDPDINNWRWGNSHKAHFIEKIIGRYPLISYASNIVNDIPGGDNTLSMSKSIRSSNNKHDVSYGSTLRVIFDLSNNDKSYFSIPTGQSGHLFSKHYDDFTELWLKGEYLQIYLDDDPIKHTNGSLMRFIRKIN